MQDKISSRSEGIKFIIILFALEIKWFIFSKMQAQFQKKKFRLSKVLNTRQFMSFLRNKFLPIALLSIFAATFIAPFVTTFFPNQADSCGMGCVGVCCCAPEQAGSQNCQPASFSSSLPVWTSCQPFKPAMAPSLPWHVDLFLDDGSWLFAPLTFEAVFANLQLSPLINLVIPPPDGPPWLC